jgi:protein involved in polysaccharide export with SLBB domain
MSQDPYLRPNDVVTFNRVERRISISGAVERPGTYQPLRGENLKDLIDAYGGGFTTTADKTRMVLLRYTSSESISGDRIILKEQDYLDNIALFDLDSITVPDITNLRPVVPLNRQERRITIAGAVRRPGTYNLMPEENLRKLIDIYGDGFTAVADKTRMVLLRYTSSESISGDRIILKEQDYLDDIALYDLDTITVPDITDLRPAVPLNREERRITIEGAVRRPGTYNLLPEENFKDLIDVYGDGFTVVADKTRMTLLRYTSGESVSGDRVILKEQDYLDDMALYHLDTITVPDITTLRPAVTLNREERRITIEGAVRRPGTYNLMPEENLRDLIEVYGDGFTPLADSARIELTRYVNSTDKVGNKIYLAEEAVGANYPLENYDVIVIPTIAGARPVLFVEGAVGVSAEGNLMASNRLMIRFEPGEDYGSLVRRNFDWFSAVSDTMNAYILRNNERIPINLNPLLYSRENQSLYYLEQYDTLVIPFRQYFVTVSGAVINPGRYPYIPDRNWAYYVSLAGGLKKDQNAFRKVTITTVDGRPMTKNDEIVPETIINAETNSFLYHFNQVAPVLTTVLSIITTFISIQLLISR